MKSATPARPLAVTFVMAAMVVLLGLAARFVFGMDSARAFNLVFSVAAGVAVSTALLLLSGHRSRHRAVLAGSSALGAVIAVTVWALTG
ncbi:MAG: hypothetical protein QME72_08190 [Rhodococcus sp. (in: high G+C Gram-positive bacteria)]|nr:hypothetical protein [Rhodococcus sp. (in: high G+C Gram-positive bacteria)]MDI6627683.1 hypothetical protein [Rhodococcus sp. (in: high G+C Gram-positive bacteria)]